jgi:hypothetical protein
VKVVAVSETHPLFWLPPNEITGLPRDNFEIHEISKAEFETFRSEILAASPS